MKRRKLLSLVATLFACLAAVHAQQIASIGGRVTDPVGNPLQGVVIALKGSPVAVTTNADGNYTIAATPGQTLLFTYLGMAAQELTLGNQTRLDVTMRADTKVLEDVVVIGYGSVRKSDLTGAVASMRASDLMSDVNTSAAGALQGKVPGVSVTNVSGQPGRGMSITIRGITSLTNNDPLYVVDGVYGDLNMIDPSDIASIEILKDASAAAIYGSRAANGVVLVTTRSGKKDSPARVDFNVQYGIQQVSKKVEVMNATEWMGFLREKGQGAHLDGSRYAKAVKGAGTDWQDEVYRTAPMYKANLTVNGGSTNGVYSTSLGYLNQEGIVRNSSYESFTGRFKSEYSFLGDRLKIGESVYLKTGIGQGGGDPTQDALRIAPIVPVHDDSRNTGWGAVEDWMNNLANPVGTTWANRMDNRRSLDVLFNGYAQLEIIDGLRYKLNYSLDQTRNNDRTHTDAFDFGAGGVNAEPDLTETARQYNQWVVENTLNYDKIFGRHSINAVAGYSAQRSSYREVWGRRENLPPGTSVLNAGNSSLQSNGGSTWRNSLVSMFGRVVYSYDGRYMLTASIRRDGSSKFEKQYRFGNFPSVSLGWNIHNESFAQGWAGKVDELKLRASYGVLGNQQISDYMTKRTLSTAINYVQGNEWWLGHITGNNWVSPTDLTWETTSTTNIGLDATFLGGRLGLTADAFVQETRDVLMPVSMPGSAGLSGSPTMNAGTIRNKGIEVALTHRNTVGQVYYSVTANMSAIDNRVTSITVGNQQEIAGYNPQGLGTVTWFKLDEPMGAFRVIKTDGIFQSQDEINAHKTSAGLIQPTAQPGDIRFVDYDGDGSITDADRQTVGKPLPDLAFGLRGTLEWRGLSLNFFFDGMVGNSIYNFPRYRIENMEKFENYSSDVLNSWTPTNKSTTMPRWSRIGADIDPNRNARVNSDRWIERGDFLRLKTLEVGYTLPEKFSQRIGMNSVRFYTVMENLFTITAYKGFTPDLGYIDTGTPYTALGRGTDHGRYPLARTVSLGIRLGF
jgi:TonB-linked SusC/RagA family outer membrane protein